MERGTYNQLLSDNPQAAKFILETLKIFRNTDLITLDNFVLSAFFYYDKILYLYDRKYTKSMRITSFEDENFKKNINLIKKFLNMESSTLLPDLISLLKQKGLTIAFAESMTAGKLAADFTSVPGVSSVLLGSIVTYSPILKTNLLGVKREIIDEYTAESEEVTLQMAKGLKTAVVADVCVSITGVASAPVNDYSVNKPVGTTFVCILYKDEYSSFKKEFQGDRNQIRQQATDFTFQEIYNVVNTL